MRPPLRHPLAGLLLGAGLLLAAPRVPAAEEAPPATPRAVDLAICLDTSGSMQGLIDAARLKLWSVVNDLARLRPEPDLRVALLTYGTPVPDSDGDVVLRLGLTRDLDRVYEVLFGLTTGGGVERVGRVLDTALGRLDWSRAEGLAVVFVAGNESADQDAERPFRAVASRARDRGLRVNAVYCGGPDDADAAGWRELAALGGGRFAHIDHEGAAPTPASPFDRELGELSGRLNDTFVFAGPAGGAAAERQRAQDANARAAGAPAAAERAAAKASGLYRLEADLVRRHGEGTLPDAELAALADADLPPALRGLDAAGRRERLAALARDRAALEARIQALDAERTRWLATQAATGGLPDGPAFDRALRVALREQARAAGFEVPMPAGPAAPTTAR